MGVNELRQALATDRVIAIDTSIVIYLLDNHPRYADLASVVMTAIEQGQVQAVTSMITLAEVLTAPAKAGNVQALQDYELYLTNFPNLSIRPPDTATARQAALVRAETGLKLPDALQIATALQVGAQAIVGNDKGWRNKTGPLQLLLLDDFL
jgi:predicted nucleic acid-binding protein